jgi:deazaflavin-dependent oxidoreductase (nitroreductase family)
MRTPDQVIEAGAWMLENGHRALLKLTGGRFPRTVLGMQPVELHTTGRKSGARRSTMLTAPIFEPGRVVLVASKGGHQDHPDWYKNLAANPDVELTAEGRTRRMRARTASAEEKAEMWPRILSAYKGYAGYQKNTDREIPVVILEPVDGAA